MISLRLILVLTVFACSATAFKCYHGSHESNFISTECIECDIGVDCSCFKIPELNGNPIRGCRANPHGAEQPGCRKQPYKGEWVDMCTCDEELCNGAEGMKHVGLLLLLVPAIMMILMK